MAEPLHGASGCEAEEGMSGSPVGAPGAGNPDALLTRALGVRQLAANIFNYTVGSGIFLLPEIGRAHV